MTIRYGKFCDDMSPRLPHRNEASKGLLSFISLESVSHLYPYILLQPCVVASVDGFTVIIFVQISGVIVLAAEVELP